MLATHFDEHRYCNNGTRYLPQKSTNLICSTRLSKKTPAKWSIKNSVTLIHKEPFVCSERVPLHLGLTQQCAVDK